MLLLLLELLHVEVELVTLEDVTVGSARLAGSGADAGQQTTRLELIDQSLLEHSLSLSGGNLSLHVGRLLNGLSDLGGGSVGALLLLGQINSVVLQIPLSEGSGIDLNDGVLGQSLSTDELLVGSVVHGIQDTSLVGSVLTGPDEVSSVESHGTELEVSTTASDSVNSLVTNLGVSSGSTELELSLLLMDVSASTSSSRKE